MIHSRVNIRTMTGKREERMEGSNWKKPERRKGKCEARIKRKNTREITTEWKIHVKKVQRFGIRG